MNGEPAADRRVQGCPLGTERVDDRGMDVSERVWRTPQVLSSNPRRH